MDTFFTLLKFRLYGLLALLTAIIISVLFQSRAFIAGFAVAGTYFALATTLPKRKMPKIVYWTVGVIFVLVVVTILSFFFKTGSTFGRILIYKISWFMFVENWVGGIGYGNFRVQYLPYQAGYFEKNFGTVSEMMLAGNTYYAFNDYWQFIIEGGLKSAFALFAGIVALYFLYRESANIANRRHQLTIRFVWSILLALLVAAFFTHLWEKPVYIYSVIQLLIILICLTFGKIDKKDIRWLMIISSLLVLTILFCSNRKEIFHYKQCKAYQEAEKLSFAGYGIEALELLKDVYPVMKRDENYLTLYGREKMRFEDYKYAINLFKQAESIRASNELYRQMGLCYDGLGDYKNAEKMLITSMYAVPNRFVTRFELFLFYKRHHRNKQMIETGQAILALPVKIASPTVEQIKKQVELVLKNSFPL